MSERGKFIVLEGTDGSGKTTQFNLICNKLASENMRFLSADFPRYSESVWGKMVSNLLNGKYGEFDEIDPHFSVLPTMLDEYTWSRDIGKPWFNNGGFIISNRYFTSNVHQIAKVRKNKNKYRKWLWDTGYNQLGIIKPTLVIFLDVHPQIAFNLINNKSKRDYLKGKKKDAAESSFDHQLASYREYKQMVRLEKDWVSISCTRGDRILSVDDIYEKVWSVCKKHLGN